MYFQRSKEPSQEKEETGTDLIKCINQVHSRKEPEQNLTARGAAEAIVGTQRSPSLLEQAQTPEAMNPSAPDTPAMLLQPPVPQGWDKRAKSIGSSNLPCPWTHRGLI